MSLEFSTAPKRTRGESIIPMINVVFLLLIFFLMTSELVPPEPFEVEPPTARDGEAGDNAPVLYLSVEGETGYRDLRGDAAIRAFVADARLASGSVPQLRADEGVEAQRFARLLREVAAAGVPNVALVIGQE